MLFRSFTENQQASKAVQLLNSNFTIISEVLREESGIFDKFNGDTAVGTFGIPFNEHDDAKRAVSAALKLRSRLKDDLLRKGLKFGYGISTGVVLTGNIGPDTRPQFTALGSPFVLCQRLTQEAKNYKVDIVIDSSTREEIKEDFHVRELDMILLKGKEKILSIFEVIDFKSVELSRDRTTSFICFELGLNEYRLQNWIMAISHFRKAVQLTDDEPSKIFIWRCKAILEGQFEVPKLGWDCTWSDEFQTEDL